MLATPITVMHHPFDPLPAPARKPLPSGMCPRDPAEPVIDVCARCGDFLCLRCGEYVRGEVYCRNCSPAHLTPVEPGPRLRGQLFDGMVYFIVVLLAMLPSLTLNRGELTLVLMPVGLLA